jgi:hypothetical protein
LYAVEKEEDQQFSPFETLSSSKTSPVSVTQRDFSPRRPMPDMTRWAPFPWIGPREDFGQFKLLAFQRWIAFQNFVPGGALFEHSRQFIHADSRSANARLAAPDLRIFNDHFSRAFETHESQAHFIEDSLEVERETASKHRELPLGRPASSAVSHDRVVQLVFTFTGELHQPRVEALRYRQVEDIHLKERSFASGRFSLWFQGAFVDLAMHRFDWNARHDSGFARRERSLLI